MHEDLRAYLASKGLQLVSCPTCELDKWNTSSDGGDDICLVECAGCGRMYRRMTRVQAYLIGLEEELHKFRRAPSEDTYDALVLATVLPVKASLMFDGTLVWQCVYGGFILNGDDDVPF